MKYLKRFFNWLFSFWLLDEKENKIEEIPQKGIVREIKNIYKDLPEVLVKNTGNSPKYFGQYFLSHKMPKYLKKKNR